MITDEQRKAFEQWATNKGFNVTRFNDYPQYMYDNTYFAWEAWKAAQQVEPAHNRVPVPQNADQAQLMALVAESWLKHNAPERLKEPAQAVPAFWASENIFNDSLRDNIACVLTTTKCAANTVPLYTHPVEQQVVPVGRVLHWQGEPGLAPETCIRSFAEYPKGYAQLGPWREGELVYTHPVPLDSDTRRLVLELCAQVIRNSGEYEHIPGTVEAMAADIIERLEAGE